jgi:hypothetical protein
MAWNVAKRKVLYRALWKGCFWVETHLAVTSAKVCTLEKGSDAFARWTRQRSDLLELALALKTAMVILSSRPNGIFEKDSAGE